jgi:hypothetical protein
LEVCEVLGREKFSEARKGRCGNSLLHLAVRVGKGSRKNLLTACFTVRRVNGRESAAGARQMVVRAPQGAADGRESAPQARQMVVRAPQARQMVVRAPQARQMVARGEREARCPWNVQEKKYRPGRPTETGQRVCRPSGARALLSVIQGQRARCARTRPWLPSAAPAALRTLATICRACGASEPRPI